MGCTICAGTFGRNFLGGALRCRTSADLGKYCPNLNKMINKILHKNLEISSQIYENPGQQIFFRNVLKVGA